MHTGTPFVSVGFTAISVLLQTLEQHLFFHTILFQLKSPEPSIYHTVSQCVYIQTSSLHIFHTIYCYISAAKPPTISNYITLYQYMIFFFSLQHHQQNKLQKATAESCMSTTSHLSVGVSSNATVAVEWTCM